MFADAYRFSSQLGWFQMVPNPRRLGWFHMIPDLGWDGSNWFQIYT